MPPRHVGVDLDNTIIDYEDVFAPVAADLGLLAADRTVRGKEIVKAMLIAADASEQLWMRLQGQVYGRHIGRARPYEGVQECLRGLSEAGVRISIVSHKTRHGHFDPDRIDLWQAARDWLASKGFLFADGLGIDPSDVHFEETREAKVRRIRTIGCEVFIDDLPEVLTHADFPAGVEAIWFAGERPALEVGGLQPHRTWREIMDSLERKS